MPVKYRAEKEDVTLDLKQRQSNKIASVTTFPILIYVSLQRYQRLFWSIRNHLTGLTLEMLEGLFSRLLF
jgi:hypothetical protein